MPHVIRNENHNNYDPEGTLVMDSKGLIDALDNGFPRMTGRSALEVPIIEELMRRADLSTSLVSPQSECSRRYDKVHG